MKKLVLAVGAVLSVGAAFAASYSVSTYVELTNALVSVVQSGDEVVIAASDEPYVLAKALTVPAGVTVRGATDDYNDVVLSGDGACGGLTLTQGTSASVQTVISNLTITSCVSAGGTAGLTVKKWSTAENCRVTGCWATAQGSWGVGVNLATDGVINRCVIDGNYTLDTFDGHRGVGIYANGGTVTDTVITNNYVPKSKLSDGFWQGGAGARAEGGATFRRCYFANNRIGAVSQGANTLGIALYASSHVYLYNCTFEQNNYESAIADNLYAVTISHASTKMQKCVFLGNRQADGALNNVSISASYADANYVDNASDGVAETLESKVSIVVSENDFVRVGGFLRPKPNSMASGLGAMPDWDGVTPADPVRVPVTNLVSDITLLQAVIDAAKPGDVIQIAKGNYTVTAPIDVQNGVIVEGATGNRDDVVLDGNNACRVANVKGATLRHVTLTRGYVNGETCGGDAFVGLGGRLENCRATGILNYNASSYAKGVAVYNNGGFVTGCLIDGNTVKRSTIRSIGYHQNCGAIDRSIIKNNTATGLQLSDGYYPGHAGFWIEYGGSMRNCIVTGNSQGNVTKATISSGCGGLLGGAGSKMINCLVYNNTYMGVVGSGVCGVVVGSSATVVNSVILDNGHVDTKAENFAGDARHKNNVTDKATADLCTDSFEGTIANLFLQTGDDLDIKAGSDLVDAGLAQWLAEQGLDLYGRARLAGEAIDIGPFEYHVPPFAVTFESPIYSALDKIETTLTATAVGDTEGTVYSWYLDDAEDPFATGTDKQSVPLVLTELGTHTVTLKAVNGAGLAGEFAQSYKVQRGTFVVNPGESIAAAIAEAEPGATVLLKAGVHTNAAAIVVNKAIALRGESREETVITGTNKVGGVSLTAAGATLANLTVTDCYRIYMHADSGGFSGVRLEAGTVMSNCVVRNCKADGTGPEGAGVCAVDGRIYDSVISNCTGGSACYVGGPSALMVRTFVCGNKSNSGAVAGDGYIPLGAGVIIDGGEVRDSVIADNVAKDSNWSKAYAEESMSASGVLIYSGKLVNCTVVGNTFTMKASQVGVYAGIAGAVANQGGTVVNCLIADNWGNDGVPYDNALDRNRPAYYTTCCTSSIESFPEGNVSSVPGPVYRYSKRLGEYRLTQGSPCAGAGTWQTWMADTPDFYGRAWNPDRVDIGAAVYDCKGLMLMVK